MCVSSQLNTEEEECVTQNVPWVEEDELHVQTGSEHEHVAVQFDLSDGAGWQRVTDGHQPHVLIAAVKRRHVQTVLTDLQVATTVNHLSQELKHGHGQCEYTSLYSLIIHSEWWIRSQESMSGGVTYANLAKRVLDGVRDILDFSSVCQCI